MFKITSLKSRNYIFEFTKWFGIHFAILMFSCNAPRSNPVDPNTPGPSFAGIEGNVSTSYVPLVGIPDVLVHWIPANKYTKTDLNGDFKIDNVRSIDGNLILSKEGFKSDTLLIIWNGAEKVFRQIHLNSLPEMIYMNITTSVEYELSGRSAEILFTAKVIDRDTQIDSVYIENANLALKKKMEISGGDYSLIVNETDLNINTLDNLIGEDFNLMVSDSLVGASFKIGSSRITRVIYNEPIAVSPLNGDTVTSPLVLNWNKSELGFRFNYLIEIYTNETGNYKPVYTSEILEPGITVLNTQFSLPPGNYFWVIWILDDFMNRARSRPAIFAVQ